MIKKRTLFNPRIYSRSAIFLTKSFEGQTFLFAIYLALWLWFFWSPAVLFLITLVIYYASTGYLTLLTFLTLFLYTIYDICINSSYSGIGVLIGFASLLGLGFLFSHLFGNYLKVNSLHWQNNFFLFTKWQTLIFPFAFLTSTINFSCTNILIVSSFTHFNKFSYIFLL